MIDVSKVIMFSSSVIDVFSTLIGLISIIERSNDMILEVESGVEDSEKQMIFDIDGEKYIGGVIDFGDVDIQEEGKGE